MDPNILIIGGSAPLIKSLPLKGLIRISFADDITGSKNLVLV